MGAKVRLFASNPPKIRTRIQIIGWYERKWLDQHERKWLDQQDGSCYNVREGSRCLLLAGHDGECLFDPKPPELGESK
jgi:hypothetical protein